MKITIHSKGIIGSGVIEEGEEPGALFGGIVEINGHVFDRITKIEPKFSEDFASVTVTFFPGRIEHIHHTTESWKALCDRAEGDIASARLADGRSLARHES